MIPQPKQLETFLPDGTQILRVKLLPSNIRRTIVTYTDSNGGNAAKPDLLKRRDIQ